MISPVIHTVDTQQFGLHRTGASYIIQGDAPSIIEAGTTFAASHIQAMLGASTPRYIFLTHIHLDHAGGAGHLARAFPDARIVVHERGCRHLNNPTRLIEGVRSASPELFALYGEPLPIPEHQLLPVQGGETFALGKNVTLEVIASPGHAPHHICFFEHTSGTLLTGDAVGNWNNPVDVPLTVPPRFDLDVGLQTLQTLKGFHPKHLAFTHFGIASDASSHLDRYERELMEWFEMIRRLSLTMATDEIVPAVLDRETYTALTEIERNMVIMCIHGALLSLAEDTASV